MEHLFGTAKENYGFRYTQMSGEARLEMKAGITFAYINPCWHFEITTKPVAMIDIECNFINCYCESDTGLYHNCGIANQIEGGYYIRFIKVLSKPFH